MIGGQPGYRAGGKTRRSTGWRAPRPENGQPAAAELVNGCRRAQDAVLKDVRSPAKTRRQRRPRTRRRAAQYGMTAQTQRQGFQAENRWRSVAGRRRKISARFLGTSTSIDAAADLQPADHRRRPTADQADASTEGIGSR
jgi:hypothetical protein